MKVFPTEVKRAIDKLPIGYYADRRIPLTMSEEADCSFFSPTEQCIVISFPQIAQGLEIVEDEDYFDTAIRSMVYHEVSHAILTPKDMEMNDVINIFEDERIETIFAGFFHNVDFKKNVCYINHWDGKTKPTTPMEKFYHVVRFRSGNERELTLVKETIEEYRWINGCSDGSEAYEYIRDIYDLYREITGEDYEETKKGLGRVSFPFDGDDGETLEGEEAPFSVTSDIEVKTESIHVDAILESAMNDLINKSFKDDPKQTEAIAIHFENFKRRTGGGAALQSYSGAINPRNIAREDFRYFDRMSVNQGSNKFGSVHLNLFLDVSGSFWSNEKVTNQLLASLVQIEKRYKFFSFDVITCSIGQKKLPKENRFIITGGGNNLDDSIFEMYRKLQKANTYNYNLILFDGDAFTDRPEGRPLKGKETNFSAFNHSNCTIISDPSNKEYIKNSVTQARVVYTRNYCAELFSNVLSTLQLALH